MKNIVLIGMPGAGKSTIGVLLAKSMLYSFVDTDLIIQNKHGKSLCDIIDSIGTDGFLKIEHDVICGCDFERSVIATGGSAVYGEQAMAHLRANGTVIYLELELEEIERRLGDIHSRGVAMKNGTTVAEIYNERKAIYEKYADITLNCSGLTAEQCVDKITEMIK